MIKSACGRACAILTKAAVLLFAMALLGGSAAPAAPPGDSPAPASDAFQIWRASRAAQPRPLGAADAEVARGVELARSRRQEMKQLMQRDPAAALRRAIRRAEKEALPQAVAAEVEDDVSGVGFVGPLMAAPATDPEAGPSASITINGQVHRVFLHGGQLDRKVWYGERVRGVALDGMAVLEDAADGARGGARKAAPMRPIETKTVTRTYSPASASIVRKGAFDRIGLAGLELLPDAPGMPALPGEIISVALPTGAEFKGLRVRSKERTLRDGVVPEPVQPSVPTAEGAQAEFVPPNAEVYGRDAPWPAEVALLTGDQNRMGHRYVSIRINPLRYVGAAKTLLVAGEVTVEVDYVLPWIKPAARTDKRIEEARRSVQSMVVNPDEVESPMPAPAAAEPAAELEADAAMSGAVPLGTGDVDYLIITSAALAPAFQALADHRRDFNGFSTEVKTVAGITAGYSGTNTQAKIRACITDYFLTRGLKYAVLGGDDTVVAKRGCYVYVGTYVEKSMPTDLYYSGLDGTWDEDGDGVYGEVRGGA